MIGREKMRFGPGALKSSRDTVVVSVFWGRENSYRIALIRRSDAATEHPALPSLAARGERAYCEVIGMPFFWRGSLLNSVDELRAA